MKLDSMIQPRARTLCIHLYHSEQIKRRSEQRPPSPQSNSYNTHRHQQQQLSNSPNNSAQACHAIDYRAKTLTTPSPPALTTSLPSLLQQTSQTPSPLMARCDTISWVQILFSRDQKRMLASWPAETASRPSLERHSAEMAEGWASMV
jgi:hypothetical protein